MLIKSYFDDKLLDLDQITTGSVKRTVYMKTLRKSILGALCYLKSLVIKVKVTGTVDSTGSDLPFMDLYKVLKYVTFKPKFFGPSALIPEGTRGVDLALWHNPMAAGYRMLDSANAPQLIDPPASGSTSFIRDLRYAIRPVDFRMKNPLQAAWPLFVFDDNDAIVLEFDALTVYGTGYTITAIDVSFEPEYALVEPAKAFLPYIFRIGEFLTGSTDKQATIGPFTTPSADLVDVALMADLHGLGATSAVGIDNTAKVEGPTDLPPMPTDAIARKFLEIQSLAGLGLQPRSGINVWPYKAAYSADAEGRLVGDDQLIALPLMYPEQVGDWDPRATTLARNAGLTYTFTETTVSPKRLLYRTLDRYDQTKAAELKALAARLGPNP